MKQSNHLSGMENSLEGRMAPNIQVGFQMFAAHWRKVNTKWRYPSHTHPMFEINIVLEGEQSMLVSNQTYLQRTGDILFIQPATSHESLGSGLSPEMTYFCLHFDIDELTLRRSLLHLAPDGLMNDSKQALEVRRVLDRIITTTIIEEAIIHKERLMTLNLSLQLLASLSGLALSARDNPDTFNYVQPELNENTIALAYPRVNISLI